MKKIIAIILFTLPLLALAKGTIFTTPSRQSAVQVQVHPINLDAVPTSTDSSLYYTFPVFSVQGNLYTPYEYAQLKDNETARVADRRNAAVQWEEGLTWLELLKQKMDNCGGTSLQNVNQDNIIDKLNSWLAKTNC